MACEVCEHCHEPVSGQDGFAIRDGFSYHDKCHKCYVCSETNLHDAEVFKGVIFCSSCSQRIFQGCSTARRTKNTTRRSRDRSHRRRSHRIEGRPRRPDGIIEMTGFATPTSSSKSCSNEKHTFIRSKTLVLSTELAMQVGKEVFEDRMKRSSAEIGMTTEVTQELLKQMNCPVVCERKAHERTAKPIMTRKKNNTLCSDLRIAELGASTEIANMALRHKSELPVIINKQHTRIKPLISESRSMLNQDSAESGDREEGWIDSAYSSLNSRRTHWMDRKLGSILKFPYNAFKRNILNRSSVVSILMSSENKGTLAKKIKILFHEDITEHQRRGLKRLYSTINRKKTPHKLGWLDLVNNASRDSRTVILNNHCRNKRCKHFKASHSYRCMRAQVMKLAGPTQSELAVFRARIKNMLAPGFLRSMAFNNRKYAIMMSQACGNSLGSSKKE